HAGALALPRQAGDLAVEAFFSAARDRDRERRLALHDSQLFAYLGQPPDFDARRKLGEAQADLHRRVQPFHWHTELPQVFERDHPGFDGIGGNPPFAGKNTITNAYGEGYIDWLKMLHEESHGASDLVAHFFRRAFNLLGDGGAFGLIATNTIAQGDTRST